MSKIKKDQSKNSTEVDKNVKPLGKKSDILNIIILIGIAILLFYAPYFRGLYFIEEMSTTLLYSGIIFLIYIISKIFSKDKKIIKSPLDIAIGALVLAYAIPIMLGIAASAQYAWDKLLRYADYYILYLIARDLVSNRKNGIYLLNTVFASALGVCILGIDAGAGSVITTKINNFFAWIPTLFHLSGEAARLMTFTFKDGFTEGRIYSTLQYPNVLASYLSAVFILITGLLVNTTNNIKRVIYGMLGFVVFYTLILTGSRGMFLIFPIVFLLLLIVVRKKEIVIDVIVTAAVPAVVGAAASAFFSGLINTSRYGLVWITVLIGMLLSGAISYFVGIVKERIYNINVKIFFIGLGAAFVIVLGIIGVGLTLEKPLVISVAEKGSAKNVSLDITGIKPNTQFSLDFDIKSSSSKPATNIYGVTVYSMNKFAELKQIANVSGGVENAKKKLNFKTEADTNTLRIVMTNSQPGAQVLFDKFVLTDINSRATRKITIQYAYLPTDLVYKIKDINFKTHNVWERFVFVEDAFKIIKDNFIFGTGGGGWKAVYHKYQSYGYASNEVHDNPVQLWVETGTFGFLVLLSILGLLVYQFFKTRKSLIESTEEDNKNIYVLISVIFVAIISLYVHSVIDFDFSLSAVSIFVWILTGVLAGYVLTENEFKNNNNGALNIFAIVIAGIVGLTLVTAGYNSIQGRLVLGERNKYNARFTKKDFQAAVPKIDAIYKKYLALQPLDETRRGDYINFLMQAYKNMPQENASAYLDSVKENVDRNIRNEPVSFESLLQAGTFYISYQEYAKGLGYMDKLTEYWKLISNAYLYKAEEYLRAGQYALSDKQNDAAKSYLYEVIKIPKAVDAVNKTAMKPMGSVAGLDQVVSSAKDLLARIIVSEMKKK